MAHDAAPLSPEARFRGAPLQLTSFVGREREIGAVREALATTRLLTLTGAGGSGKTRLALEVVSRTFASTPTDGVWVELAQVHDAALLPEVILTALGVRDQGDNATVDRLVHGIGERPFLLVLDNCEHLVEGCALLADALLRACAGMRLVVTSREALGVTGETAWLVPALSLPPMSGEAAESSEAVQLFVLRARAVSPAFTLTNENRAAVVQICRRLDGLPLALELAAARLRALTPQQVASRLDDRFRLLTTGNRAALPRHQTLRAAIDWSFNLLDTAERMLLARLGAFGGSFTLEGAEAVGEGGEIAPEGVLDLLASLVEKSLVEMIEEAGAARYRLLETVRDYAVSRLGELGERDEREAKHADYYFTLTQKAEPHLRTSQRPRWVGILGPELENLRQALAWTRVNDEARHLNMVATLHWFWFSSGRWPEARQWLRGALALPAGQARTRDRARLLFSSGAIASLQAQSDPALPHLTEAASIAREVGDTLLIADSQNYLGMVLNQLGDPAAELVLLEARARFRETNDLYGLRLNFLLHGVTLALRGELTRAVEATEEGVRIARVFGLDRELAIALQQLATMVARAGDLKRTAALLREALEAMRRDPQHLFLARALELMAACAASTGDAVTTARLYGAGQEIRDAIGAEMWSVDRTQHAPFVAQATEALGEEAFAEAAAAGHAMGREAAIDLALEVGTRMGHDRAPDPSTHTAEYEVPHAAITDLAPSLNVRTLGAFELSMGGVTASARDWRFAKARELLIFLLLHPEGKTREQVGLALWPDATAAQVRNNFHVTMHHLRRALGNGEWVRFEGERYRVAVPGPVILDARAFEEGVTALVRATRRASVPADSWREVLSLYRGDFLDGAAAGDWHLEFRDRLARLHAEALELAGGALLQEGRLDEAAATFEALVRQEPLHEEGYRGLIVARARAGDRAGAEREFRRLEGVLRREGMGAPSPEVRAIASRAQRGEAL